MNGYTTLDLIREELPHLKSFRPDLVSILIGVNDLVQGRSADQYRKSLRTIYDSVAGGKAFAVSIPTWSYVPAVQNFGGADRVDHLTRTFNAVSLEEAQAHGFAWVDIGEASTSGIGTKGWIASDQLHPGDVQYAAWAEVIWAVTKRWLGAGPER